MQTSVIDLLVPTEIQVDDTSSTSIQSQPSRVAAIFNAEAILS